MTRIVEMNELTMEPNDCSLAEWQEIHKQHPANEWETVRSWKIDDNTRLYEQRSSRNHLSIVGYFHKEAASREQRGEAITCVFTAFTILNNPEGGNDG